MMNINLNLQVIPKIDDKDTYRVVDEVIKYIDSTGVKYMVDPMGTTMEGDIDQLFEIVKVAQEICIKEGAQRVASVIKIDYKPEGVTMDEKIYKYKK